MTTAEYLEATSTLAALEAKFDQKYEDPQMAADVRLAFRAKGILTVEKIRACTRANIVEYFAEKSLAPFVVDELQKLVKYSECDAFVFTSDAAAAANAGEAKELKRSAVELSFSEFKATFPTNFDPKGIGCDESRPVLLPVMIQSSLPTTRSKPLDTIAVGSFTNAVAAFLLIKYVCTHATMFLCTFLRALLVCALHPLSPSRFACSHESCPSTLASGTKQFTGHETKRRGSRFKTSLSASAS